MEPGTYIALSLGQFIQLLVDNGDVAVVTQILEDGPKTADGAFVRRMELILIPMVWSNIPWPTMRRYRFIKCWPVCWPGKL